MKKCNHCGRWKDEKEFSFRNRLLGIRANTCKECKRQQDASWYERHRDEQRQRVKERLSEKRQAARDFVFDYLSYHVCEVCGEYRPEMLQFDHVRGKKVKSISELVQEGASIETIQKEILKCRVVCANCHQLAERRRREK